MSDQTLVKLRLFLNMKGFALLLLWQQMPLGNQRKTKFDHTMEALVSEHLGMQKRCPLLELATYENGSRNAATGGVRDKWLLTGACPANH